MLGSATKPNFAPSARHVILGAGQVGSLLATRLIEQGHAVRVAKRSPGGIPAAAEAMLGDAADPRDLNLITVGDLVAHVRGRLAAQQPGETNHASAHDVRA